jgi:hypothetical protein
MLEEGIFRCFVSRAQVGRKTIPVDVAAAERLKYAAVFRGFMTRKAVPRRNLTAWERLVIVMRDVTSGESFNHEWWAAEISKPEWVKKLDNLLGGSWLYYPTCDDGLNPRRLGDRIGYQLGLQERKLSRAIGDSAYRSQAEKIELAKAIRGGVDRENMHKWRLVIPGYSSWKEFAQENVKIMPQLRQLLVAIAGDQPLPDSALFLEGLTQGTRRAMKVDLDSELSDDNEREEVVDILRCHWPEIDKMKSRREITDFILARLPDRRRKFLEQSRNTEEQHQFKRFVERLRQTYYEPIGLRPRGRGRPEKNREIDS